MIPEIKAVLVAIMQYPVQEQKLVETLQNYFAAEESITLPSFWKPFLRDKFCCKQPNSGEEGEGRGGRTKAWDTNQKLR